MVFRDAKVGMRALRLAVSTILVAACLGVGREARGDGVTEAEVQLGAFMGASSYLDGALSRSGDVDTYAFTTLATGSSNDYVQVDLRGLGSALLDFGTVKLSLCTADGSPFGEVQTRNGATNSGFAYLRLPDVPPGTYFLRIEEVSGFGITGAYALQFHLPIAPDEYDANGRNDTPETAAALEPDPETGGIDRFGLSLQPFDEDWFAFTTHAGGGLSDFVELADPARPWNFVLELYAADGVTLLATTQNLLRDSLALTLLPPGSYLLRVRGEPFLATVNPDAPPAYTSPNYSLRIRAPLSSGGDRLEANDSPEQATDFGTVAGLRVEERLTLHSSSDEDWFAFDLEATGGDGNGVGVFYDSAQGDLALALLDEAGAIVDVSASGEGLEVISLLGLPPGRYQAVVFSVFGTGVLEYGLAVMAPGASAASAPDSFEPNDSREAVNAAAPGIFQSPNLGLLIGAHRYEELSLHEASDRDWFGFQTSEPGRLGHGASIAFEHAQGDLDLHLYDADGELLERSAGVRDFEEVSLQGRPAGRYYLEIRGHDGVANPRYTLSVSLPGGDRFEANDELGTATDLAFGGESAQSLALSGLSVHASADEDWFSFPISSRVGSAHFARIDFAHRVGDLDMELLAASGETIRVSDGVGDFERLALEGLSVGETYFLRVYGYDGAVNGSYRLSLELPATIAADSFESNDTLETATALADLERLRGAGEELVLGAGGTRLNAHTASDVDWFRLDTAAPGAQGDAAVILFDHTDGDLDLELFDDSGTRIDASEGVANRHEISLQDLEAGTWYLRVSGFAGATSSGYTLRVLAPWAEATGDPYETNDTIAQAADLGTISGIWRRENLSLDRSGDHDWFRFRLAGAGDRQHAVGVAFRHSQGDIDLALYDTSGVLLRESSGLLDGEEISLHGLEPGEYALLVQGYEDAANPAYELHFAAPEPGEDWAEANDSASNAFDLRQVKGAQTWDPLSIHVAGDEDWFRITTVNEARSEHVVAIQFDPALGDLDLAVFDSSGQIELGAARTANGVETVQLSRLSNGGGQGEYLLLVTGHRGATNPRYRLFVDAPTRLAGDWAEANDSAAAPARLGEIQGSRVFDRLSAHQAGDEDWFQFTTIGPGEEGHEVSLFYNRLHGELSLAVLDPDGAEHRSETLGDRESISLAGLPQGTSEEPYLVRVTGADETQANPDYTLSISAPREAEADWAEANDSLEAATPLRRLQGAIALGGLSLHDEADEDWFAFEIDETGQRGEEIRALFDGDEVVSLELRDEGGTTLLRSSLREADASVIPLEGLSPGRYALRAYSPSGSPQPEYQLLALARDERFADPLEDNDTPSEAVELRQDLAGAAVRRNDGLGIFEPIGPSPAELVGRLSTLQSLRVRQAQDAALQGGSGVRIGLRQLGLNGLLAPGAIGGGFQGLVGLDARLNPFDPLSRAAASITDPRAVGQSIADFDRRFGALFAAGAQLSPVASSLFQRSAASLPAAGAFANQPAVPSGPQLLDLARQQGNTLGANALQRVLSGQFVPIGEVLGSFGAPGLRPGGFAPSGFGASSFAPGFGGFNRFGLTPNQAFSGVGSLFGIPAFRSSQPARAVLSFPGLSIGADDADWFRLELAEDGGREDFASILFAHAQGDLRLELFEAFAPGEVAADQYGEYLVETAQGSGNGERISLANLRSGAYFLRVSGVDGAQNPAYTLSLSAALSPDPQGDFAEPNETPEEAYDLRAVEGEFTVEGLSVHSDDDEDWFGFAIVQPGTEAHRLRIGFSQGQGDLDLELYATDSGERIAISDGQSDEETVSLAGLSAGSYRARIFGHHGAVNPYYRLSLAAPSSATPPDRLEPNNAEASATDLDELPRAATIRALTVHAGTPGASDDDVDVFSFTLPTDSEGSEGHYVQVESERGSGPLLAELRRETGADSSELLQSVSLDGSASLSLKGLAAGRYFAVVRGAEAGATGEYHLYVSRPSPIEADSGGSASAENEWTILVYMTASTLAPFAFEDLNEMELATARMPPGVQFAALYDQSALATTYATADQAPWGDTGRAIIRPDTNPERLATRFERLGELNTGDPASLESFLNWAHQAAPARRYALVLWDHGGGDLDGFNVDDADEHPEDRLTTDELESVLAGLDPNMSERLEVLAFDACNMAMIEVGYALADRVPVWTASQETVSGSGHAYARAFASLALDPEGATSEALATDLVQTYQEAHQGDAYFQDTQSAIRSDALKEGLTEALGGFVNAVLEHAGAEDWAALASARERATAFFQRPEYRDLGQFLEGASALSREETIRQGALETLQALRASVAARAADQRQTTGLSIYFPQAGAGIDAGYIERHTAFLDASGWLDFLEAWQAQLVGGTTMDRDWAEANDHAARAFNLQTLSGHGHRFQGLNLHDGEDRDWFRFLPAGPLAEGDRLTLAMSGDRRNPLRLSIMDASRKVLASGETSATQARVALDLAASGAPDGEVLFVVESVAEVGAAGYDLQIDAPEGGAPSSSIGGNQTRGKAARLGAALATTLYPGLALEPGEQGWFAFETPRNHDRREGAIRIRPAGAERLVVTLMKAGEDEPIASRSGAGDLVVSYPAATGEEYFIRVENEATDRPAAYTLEILPNGADRLQATIDMDLSFSQEEGLALSFMLESGRRYRIERSADMRNWQPVEEATAGEGALDWSEGAGHGSGQDRRFYRVVILDEEP